MRTSRLSRILKNGLAACAVAVILLEAGCSIERAAFYADRGSELASRGKHEEAIAAFQEADRLNPNWAAPHLEMGKSLWALGRHQEALAAFREATRLDPRDAEAKQWFEQALSELSTKG